MGSVLDVHTLAAVLIIAAVLGNVVNYTIGHFFGEQLFLQPRFQNLSPGLSGQDPCLLCQAWRQDHHHHPLPAHSAHLRPFVAGMGP